VVETELGELGELGQSGWVRFWPEWLASTDADRLLSELERRVSWTQGTLKLFGQSVLEPRLSAWFGEFDYTYSGRTLERAPYPAGVPELLKRVESASKRHFNSVLVNRYRDGSDSMGLHSDDEPELGVNPVIASVSLGAARRFVLKAKKKSQSPALVSYELGHGSLLIMGGSCQHDYRHALPKRVGLTAERINLTFRFIHA